MFTAKVLMLIFLSKTILSRQLKAGEPKEFKNCFDIYCLPNDYNKISRPVGVVDIGVDYNISQISDIDDVRCQFYQHLRADFLYSQFAFVSLFWLNGIFKKAACKM